MHHRVVSTRRKAGQTAAKHIRAIARLSKWRQRFGAFLPRAALGGSATCQNSLALGHYRPPLQGIQFAASAAVEIVVRSGLEHRAKTPVHGPNSVFKKERRLPMNALAQSNFTCLPSARAQRRMLSQPGEPLFIAAWLDALMIHFEVDAADLQRDVPFELDLWDGRAFVSLVAFTMRDMRPRFGGKWTALLFRPIATHHFLNVWTYVRHGEECGIHFLAEWLTNRLAVMLGPRTFGLPYRYGRISYRRDLENGVISGRVADGKGDASLTFETLGRSSNSALPFQACAGWFTG